MIIINNPWLTFKNDLKLRRYAAWSPLGLAGFTTGEVSRSRLVAAQSEQSLLSSLFCIITLLSD